MDHTGNSVITESIMIRLDKVETMKKNKCTIVETGSDAWLKEFKEALSVPSFKFTPAKDPARAWRFKGKKLTNIKIAQSFCANHDPVLDQMVLASKYHNPEACESWDHLYINTL